MLPCTDKSKLMHAIEENIPQATTNTDLLEPSNAAIIIGGMTLVNKIPINRDIKTCYDFKVSFSNRLIQEAKGFSEVRLVFDRYVNSSLKEQCREKRSSGKHIKYIMKDSTLLEGIKMKDFLSHIEPKSNLTTYLAEHASNALKESGEKLL